VIFFDTTKTGRPGKRSGLNRVSSRLRESLGSRAREVVWDAGWRDAARGNPVSPESGDTLLTSELFSEAERPGFTAFIASRRCRLAAIFHDAIPLQHPHITWPRSVARHPGYMKLLARFDRVWAVSESSRTDLQGFWQWQGIEKTPPVQVLVLGADFNAAPRVVTRRTSSPSLLCLGIIEPRKNQSFLLGVCAELWSEGFPFELHVVGRVNPHFGAAIIKRLEALRRTHRKQLHFHQAATDAVVQELYATSRASVFPTIAEGCGLPLLESLWMGVPCVCSDLPVLRENVAGGGCLAIAPNDPVAWKKALREILTDDGLHARLTHEATARPLPTWSSAADTLAAALAGPVAASADDSPSPLR
jgi:glycosyltransferase involved in cell wall biosynthesis